MALTKVTYTDDVTVVGAQNLNDIQDEILRIDPSYATGKKINANDDLNNYTTPGVYFCESGTTALTLVNTPSGLSSAFSLTVTIKGGSYRIQLLTAGYQTYTRVSGSSGWSEWYTFAYFEGGTFTGNINVVNNNTATTQGYSKIEIGNNIGVGTAGNSTGILRLYPTGATYYTDVATTALTANRNIVLPDASGTVMVPEGSTTATDFDGSSPLTTNTGLHILDGISSTAGYISFDIGWIRLQFKATNTAVQCRVKYGGSVVRDWQTICSW